MEAKDGGGGWRGWRGGWGAVRRDEGGGMLAGRMRVSVRSEGSCSEGSESLSESSSMRACWDIWCWMGRRLEVGGWRLEVGETVVVMGLVNWQARLRSIVR